MSKFLGQISKDVLELVRQAIVSRPPAGDVSSSSLASYNIVLLFTKYEECWRYGRGTTL